MADSQGLSDVQTGPIACRRLEPAELERLAALGEAACRAGAGWSLDARVLLELVAGYRLAQHARLPVDAHLMIRLFPSKVDGPTTLRRWCCPCGAGFSQHDAAPADVDGRARFATSHLGHLVEFPPALDVDELVRLRGENIAAEQNEAGLRRVVDEANSEIRRLRCSRAGLEERARKAEALADGVEAELAGRVYELEGDDAAGLARGLVRRLHDLKEALPNGSRIRTHVAATSHVARLLDDRVVAALAASAQEVDVAREQALLQARNALIRALGGEGELPRRHDVQHAPCDHAAGVCEVGHPVELRPGTVRQDDGRHRTAEPGEQPDAVVREAVDEAGMPRDPIAVFGLRHWNRGQTNGGKPCCACGASLTDGDGELASSTIRQPGPPWVTCPACIAVAARDPRYPCHEPLGMPPVSAPRMVTTSVCPACGRRMCDCTPAQRGQTQEQMVEPVPNGDPTVSSREGSANGAIPSGQPAWVRDVSHGLYRITWLSGGQSLAAVGSGPDGRRWLAPTNWIGPSFDDWGGVRAFSRVDDLVPSVSGRREIVNALLARLATADGCTDDDARIVLRELATAAREVTS